jgi:predicted kinase
MPASAVNLILLRGLPGAGKTTFAKLISQDGIYPVISVDEYFENESGEYHFRFEENHIAYQQCFEKTKTALQEGNELVIVHHTFTMDWEMEPYQKLSKEFDCRLHVLTVENYHHSENTHDISKEQIEKMAAKYKVKLM